MVADDGQGLTQSRPPVTASMPTLCGNRKLSTPDIIIWHRLNRAKTTPTTHIGASEAITSEENFPVVIQGFSPTRGANLKGWRSSPPTTTRCSCHRYIFLIMSSSERTCSRFIEIRNLPPSVHRPSSVCGVLPGSETSGSNFKQSYTRSNISRAISRSCSDSFSRRY